MKKRIHFIGIGGIGISALAQYFKKKGWEVSGSDLKRSEITELLEKKGIKIFTPHRKENLPLKVKKVIFSLAVPEDNIELKTARERKGVEIKSYPEALGELTKKYFTIAISGTHGKTTTTSLIAMILIEAGFDPTVFVGTLLSEFGNSNFRWGRSEFLVIEADEYKNAFLSYWPNIIVLTTLEKEHLDFFGNFENEKRSFKKYIFSLEKKENGILVANFDDKGVRSLLKELKKEKRKFKIVEYSLKRNKKEVLKIKKVLKIPGRHNLSNALGAFFAAKVLGIKESLILKGLGKYKGAWRRFEIFYPSLKKKKKEIRFILISDYAHHPTEVKATLKAVKEKFKGKRIITVFQPHQYQRTEFLFSDFVKAFDLTDFLFLTEIFAVAGREKEKKISSKDLAEKIKRRWQKMGKRGGVQGK